MKISIDSLEDTVTRIIQDYGEEAERVLAETAKEVAKQAKRKLVNTSPNDTGKYAKGWSYRVVKPNRFVTKVSIYNTKKPGLTHLLENGHATRNGTARVYPDTPAHPHIEKVNEEAQLDFIDRLEGGLGF